MSGASTRNRCSPMAQVWSSGSWMSYGDDSGIGTHANGFGPEQVALRPGYRMQYRGQLMPLIATDGGSLPREGRAREAVLVFNEDDRFKALSSRVLQLVRSA